MAYKVNETATAIREIDACIDYIGEKLANPIAAYSLASKIREEYSSIAETPGMYPFVKAERLKQHGYRKALVNRYILIFSVDEEARSVHILHFFHASQDYEKYI